MGLKFPKELIGSSLLKESDSPTLSSSPPKIPISINNNDDVSKENYLKLTEARKQYDFHFQESIRWSRKIQEYTDALLGVSICTTSADEANCSIEIENSAKRPATEIINRKIEETIIKVKCKFFPRKPRTILVDEKSDTFATFCLDGSIQWCYISDQSIKSTIYLPMYAKKACFAEDATSVASLNGMVISSRGNSTKEADNTSQLFFIPWPKNDRSPQDIVELSHHSYPHQKSISVIQSLNGLSPRLITGSTDKIVALWNLQEKDDLVNVASVQTLHSLHTSVVLAVGQTISNHDNIWTGGVDCRLVGWSIEQEKTFFSERFSHRFNHLLSNTHHPNTLLCSFSSSENQLRLLDVRCPSTQLKTKFGISEIQAISRYTRPAWSSDGNFIALGTSSPSNRISSVQIWDIRNIKQHPFVIEAGCERKFLDCAFASEYNTLLALSSDSALSTIDYKTRK